MERAYQPTAFLFRRLFSVGVVYYGNESTVCLDQEELEEFLIETDLLDTYSCSVR